MCLKKHKGDLILEDIKGEKLQMAYVFASMSKKTCKTIASMKYLVSDLTCFNKMEGKIHPTSLPKEKSKSFYLEDHMFKCFFFFCV